MGNPPIRLVFYNSDRIFRLNISVEHFADLPRWTDLVRGELSLEERLCRTKICHSWTSHASLAKCSQGWASAPIRSFGFSSKRNCNQQN